MAKSKKKTSPAKVAGKSKAKKVVPITWASKQVKASDINPTPKNYKIKTDLGRERLQQSLAMFGLAGNVVVNPAKQKGKWDLIDGNSRWEQEMAKGPNTKMWVSVPSRPLTPKEYQEMSAMFDFAKAGEVDMERIQGDLGTAEEFYKKWNLEVPMELLEKMGSKADIKEFEYPEEGEGSKKKGKDATPEMADIKLVQLFFSDKQEEEFRKMEEKGKKKFKVSNTTDFVWKALKSIKF